MWLILSSQKGKYDVSQFDKEFTRVPAVDSVVGDSVIKDADQLKFDGFTFVSDGVMKT